MKINFLKGFILLSCIIGTISCSNDEESMSYNSEKSAYNTKKVGDVEEMAQDPEFVAYVISGVEFYSGVIDPGKIQDIMEDGKVDAIEEDAAYEAFGVGDKAGFEHYQNTQRARYENLEKNYGISLIPESEIRPIFEQVIINQYYAAPPKNKCKKYFNLCTAAAMSGALATHGGCLSIDVATAGAGAIFCHGGTFLGQMIAHAYCQYQYEDCMGW